MCSCINISGQLQQKSRCSQPPPPPAKKKKKKKKKKKRKQPKNKHPPPPPQTCLLISFVYFFLSDITRPQREGLGLLRVSNYSHIPVTRTTRISPSRELLAYLRHAGTRNYIALRAWSDSSPRGRSKGYEGGGSSTTTIGAPILCCFRSLLCQ